jgi:hypothetical protein
MNDWNDHLNRWFFENFPLWLGDAFRWPVIILGPIMLGLLLVVAHRARHPYQWMIWAGVMGSFTAVGRSIDNISVGGMSYAVLFNFSSLICGYVFLYKWLKKNGKSHHDHEDPEHTE